MMHPTTLLISQDASLANAVRDVIRSVRGFQLSVVSDVETACNEILEHDEIVVTLVHLDGTTNVSELTRILQVAAPNRRPMVTIVISDHAHPEQTLIFSRLGVAECVSRPLDLGRLSYLIDVLTIETRYGSPRRITKPDLDPVAVQSLGDEAPFYFQVGGRMGRTMEQIKRIAPLETTVVIGGETGTGKSHLAGVIHRLSPRRERPFMTINCGALSANLIESEMFGHARGAFTGADTERTGKFAAVGRGTLFLDEIDSLPPELQTKLLRVVEERAFEPVGSNKTLRLQARLIVASNRPLEREVAAGRFRSDLFYRLNVLAFDIPPLRERIGVIPTLARVLVADHATRNDRQVEGIDDAAMRALLAYSWPGNIRELRNVIEHAVALGHGPTIVLDDFPERFRAVVAMDSHQPTDPVAVPAESDAVPDVESQGPQPLTTVARATLTESKNETERAIIAQALERNRDNRLRAAAELGISRMTLYKKLHKYGLMGIQPS